MPPLLPIHLLLGSAGPPPRRRPSSPRTVPLSAQLPRSSPMIRLLLVHNRSLPSPDLGKASQAPSAPNPQTPMAPLAPTPSFRLSTPSSPIGINQALPFGDRPPSTPFSACLTMLSFLTPAPCSIRLPVVFMLKFSKSTLM